MVQAIDTIDRRVNELGVSEPNIARYGENDQILVQLPGVTDVRRAKDIIRDTALLELKMVEGGPAPTRGPAAGNQRGQVPSDMEVVTAPRTLPPVRAGTSYFLVRKVAAITGGDLRTPAVGPRRKQPACGHVLAGA